MLYKVTSIDFDFDFDSDELPTLEEQRQLVDSVCSGDWEANDEDDLIESITDESGWCIYSLTYETVGI